MSSAANVMPRLEKYPFLRNVDQVNYLHLVYIQVYLGMGRILASTETRHTSVRDSWEKIWCTRILKEADSQIREVVEHCQPSVNTC